MPKGGGGGQSTNTVVQASPLQELQAQYAAQIAPNLLDYILGGMKGVPTPGQIAGTQTGMGMLRQNAGQMGISPGDPRMMDAFRKMTEGLTKPNPDVLGMAQSLYTGAPTAGGSSKSTTDPGFMGTLGGLGNLGLTGALTYSILNNAGVFGSAAAAPGLESLITDVAMLP